MKITIPSKGASGQNVYLLLFGYLLTCALLVAATTYNAHNIAMNAFRRCCLMFLELKIKINYQVFLRKSILFPFLLIGLSNSLLQAQNTLIYKVHFNSETPPDDPYTIGNGQLAFNESNQDCPGFSNGFIWHHTGDQTNYFLTGALTLSAGREYVVQADIRRDNAALVPNLMLQVSYDGGASYNNLVLWTLGSAGCYGFGHNFVAASSSTNAILRIRNLELGDGGNDSRHYGFRVYSVPLPPPVAVTENGSAPASGGIAVVNVRSNDLVNSAAATSANSTISQSGTWPAGITLTTTTGAINVAAGTPAGVYNVVYQLCNLETPTPNCVTVSNTISVLTDTDNDGVADITDLDDDNDGIPDEEESVCNVGFYENFGTNVSGRNTIAQKGLPGSSTSYSFGSSGHIQDGFYVITNSINSADMGGWWNPTTVDPVMTNGGFLLVNGTTTTNVYKSPQFSNWIPGTTYKLTFKVQSANGGGIIPNLQLNVFQGTTTTSPIGTLTTGNISSLSWETYQTTFTVPTGVTSGYFSISSLAGAGGGNDFAIDEIKMVDNALCDTDGDGIVNSLDLDSDGDGCKDVAESGGVDANNDGKLDGTGFDATGKVTGGMGGYNGIAGGEYIAHGVTITTAPTNQTAAPGAAASFTVAANVKSSTTFAGGVPDYTASIASTTGLTYQWYDGNPASGGVALTNTGVYTGATTATLNISNATGLDGKQYFVRVGHSSLVCPEVASATLSIIAITPVTEKLTITSGSSSITDIRANDTVNGVAATSANSTTSQSGTWPAGITLTPATGIISVAAGTAPSKYAVSYQLCDLATPMPNCATVLDSITVLAPVTLMSSTGQTANVNQSKTGNAATELAPTGGTGSYTYSIGNSDPACTAPSGATALPAASNLSVTSGTGAYNFTAPATAGVYYFCIKVCDTAAVPSCKVATYTVVAVCNAGTVAPKVH